LAVSPDGSRLVWNEDTNIRVSNASTGQSLSVIKGHTGWVDRLHFTPGGNRLVSLGSHFRDNKEQTQVKVWDLRSGKEIPFLQEGPEGAKDLALSPDGTRLAVCGTVKKRKSSNTGWVKVFGLDSGKELLSFPSQGFSTDTVRFSPDGTLIASAGSSGKIILWDRFTGKELFSLSGHRSPVVSLAFRADGALLASVAQPFAFSGIQQAGEVKVWNVRPGELSRGKVHTGPVTSLAVSPDGSILASMSPGSGQQPGEVKVWDTWFRRELFPLPSSRGLVTCGRFRPDGRALAAGMLDGKVCVWDLRTGALRWRAWNSGPVLAVSFSPDGKRLAVTVSGLPEGMSEVVVSDALTGALKGKYPFGGPLSDVAFSPNGKFLAVSMPGEITAKGLKGLKYGRVIVLDGATHRVVRKLGGISGESPQLAFSPDGKRLALGGRSFTPQGGLKVNSGIKVWDTNHWKEVRSPLSFLQLDCFAFSQARNLLGAAVRSLDENARLLIWDARTVEEITSLEGPFDVALDLTFSRDGTRLACGYWDSGLRLWDLRTHQAVLKVAAPREVHPSSLVFGPKDGFLVQGMSDGTVRFLASRKRPAVLPLAKLSDPLDTPRVAFSIDGNLVAVGNRGGLVRIWDTRTRNRKLTLRGGGPIQQLAFSPDGTRLATSDQSPLPELGRRPLARTKRAALPKTKAGEIRLWDLNKGRLSRRWKSEPVSRLAWSPEGKWLAFSRDFFDNKTNLPTHSQVRIWNAQTGNLLPWQRQTSRRLASLEFSRNGGRLIATDDREKVHVWDARTGKPIPKAKDRPGVRKAFHSPDGKWLVVSEDGALRLARAPDRKELAFRRRMTAPDPVWHRRQAGRFAKEKRWFAAAFHLDRLLRIRPTDVEAHRRRADLYLRAGDVNRALAHWLAIALLKTGAKNYGKGR
jgi:WD40 repeat protein